MTEHCTYDDTVDTFDFSCMKCRARWFKRLNPDQQQRAEKLWRQIMPAGELAAIFRIVGSV
jgi:hypothetical protein